MAKKSSHHRRRRHAGPPADRGAGLGDGRDDAAHDDDGGAVDGAMSPLALGAGSQDEPDPNDNALADAVLRFIDGLRPHFRTILAAGAGIAALLVAWAVVSSQREAGRTQSWDACLSAMASGDIAALEEVIRRHPDTDAARWSDLVVADVACSEGTELLYADRTRAEGRLRAAADRYTAILAARPRGLLAERATFGLAKARESLGQLAEARRGYETVAAEFPGDPLAGVASARAAQLGRDSARQWYDWFAAHPPTPPAPASTGSAAVPAAAVPAAAAPAAAVPAAGVPATSPAASAAPKASDDVAAPATPAEPAAAAAPAEPAVGGGK